MKRLRRLALRLLLLGMTSLVLLLLLEAFFRWDDARKTRAVLADASKAGVIPSDIPGLYYTLRPGMSNDVACFNSHGFNMPERPRAKPPGMWRIAVVGDSVTQGVGATNRGDAWPNRLDTLVRAASGTNCEVWNCGTGGYNVDQVALMLTHIVTNFAPDAVIYGFCFNDYWGPNYYLSGQAAQPAGTGEAGGGRVGLLDRVKQLRTATRAKLLYDDLFYGAHGYLPVFVDRKIAYPSWIAMKRQILTMRDFCAARGWPFAVVIVPMQQFIFVDDERNLALRDLKRHLEENDIPFLDTTPALRARRDEGLFVQRNNHPNSTGYSIVADAAAAWVTSNAPALLPPKGIP